MFELHEFEGKYYLKIFYREDDSKKRYTIAKVTSARLLCECLLDDFKQNNEDVLPTKDPNKECISKGEIWGLLFSKFGFFWGLLFQIVLSFPSINVEANEIKK